MRRLKFARRPKGLEAELAKLHRGRSSFDEFARATRGDWRRLAGYLRRRWQVPAAVEVEDVEQELLIAAWRAVDAWNPARGVTLRSYVVWTAATDAKKFLHRQRAALRRDDGAASRHDLAMSFVGGATDRSIVDAEQEFVVSGLELFFEFAAGARPFELVCLEALAVARGDVALATGVLYGNTAARVAFRLGNEAETRAALVRTATRLVTLANMAEGKVGSQ